MSIADDARLVILAADYIGIDAGGKLNAIGAGFTMMGVQPGQPVGPQQMVLLTAPMHLAVLVDVPGEYAGQEFAVSLELRDDATDAAVQLPSESGEPEALRVAQMVKAERPTIPGVYVPAEMFCRVQLTLGFPTGLPLRPGGFYSWYAEIDGQHRPDWVSGFHVPGPPPGPVFGGPVGPGSIPNLPFRP